MLPRGHMGETKKRDFRLVASPYFFSPQETFQTTRFLGCASFCTLQVKRTDGAKLTSLGRKGFGSRMVLGQNHLHTGPQYQKP